MSGENGASADRATATDTRWLGAVGLSVVMPLPSQTATL